MDSDFFQKWLTVVQKIKLSQKTVSTLQEITGQRDYAVSELVAEVPNHYVKPSRTAERIAQMGYKQTGQALMEKMPQTKTARSADIGEILAAEYVRREFKYDVPINKLVWKDSRELALRGDDVIGISISGNNTVRLLKVEAKSRAKLSTSTLEEAENGLNTFKGRPNPHSLLFIAERLDDQGQKDIATLIEKNTVKGFRVNQIEQLLFSFSGNNSHDLASKKAKKYNGQFVRHYIGLVVEDHQNFIKKVYQEIVNKWKKKKK